MNIKILRHIKMMSLSALREEMKLVPTSESVLTFLVLKERFSTKQFS
jgi:hypothetical protein